MKKLFLLVALLVSLCFVSCGGETFIVSFDSNGGTLVSSQEIKAGENATKPTPPTKEGYQFNTWLDETDKVWDFEHGVVLSDITLYALWEQTVATASFDLDGGTINGETEVDSQKVEIWGKATNPGDPEKAGHSFDGWYSDEAISRKWDFMHSEVRINVTLKAKWVATRDIISTTTEGYNLRYLVDFATSTATLRGLEFGFTPSDYSKDLNIPATVTSHGATFSVVTIADFAFSSEQSFTGKLSIPDTVVTIGNYAFHATGITGELTIPNSVITIGASAFASCSDLNGKLTIGTKVEIIRSGAFYATGITGDLTIPDSVTAIGGSAFRDCANVTGSLTIPDSVETIGEYAFAGCEGFTGNLIIGNSVETIGNSAFSSCEGFAGTLVLGSSLETIGENAFASCYYFTGNLVIPDSVITIGDNAFSSCQKFDGDLTIGNSVQTIGSNAFLNCYAFAGTLTIGESVTSIEDKAFYQCQNITKVISHPTTPPTAQANTFNNVPEDIIVQVPSASLDLYQDATRVGWNRFSNYSAIE